MKKNEIREETEAQLLGILALHNEMFEVLQIKPSYLFIKKNQQLLSIMLDSYEKNGVLTPKELLEKNLSIIDDILEIYETQLITSNYKKEFFILQKEIIEFYKEDIILKLNEQLKNNEIDYETFVNKINKLQEIQISDVTHSLTKEDLISNITNDKKEVLIRNYPKINNVLKLVQGDFLIIGATTGVGKSGLLLNLMNGLMDDYQCIYFNMEMSISTIYKRILSIRSDVPLSYLDNPTKYQQTLIEKASEEIEKNNVYVEHKATDIISIKSIIKKLKNHNKHTIIFLDHLGLIKTDKKSLYEQATEVSKALRQICLDYDCTIIGASQLNRSAYGSEEITLSMLKDSGELENSASKVILMYRDKEEVKDNPQVTMYLEIAKNRDGQLGIIKTNYDKTKQIFKEI